MRCKYIRVISKAGRRGFEGPTTPYIRVKVRKWVTLMQLDRCVEWKGQGKHEGIAVRNLSDVHR